MNCFCSELIFICVFVFPQRYASFEPVQSAVSSVSAWEKPVSSELKDEKPISPELKEDRAIGPELEEVR